MTARLLPDAEIKRAIDNALAYSEGREIASLVYGRDYVQVIFPSQGGDSVAQYIGDTHRPQRAGKR